MVLVDAVGEHSCFILVCFRERDGEDLAGFGRGGDDQELAAGFEVSWWGEGWGGEQGE